MIGNTENYPAARASSPPYAGASRQGLEHPHPPAFTLIELLAAISIIVVLAALLLPALARGKSKARITYCLGSKHQLALGWLLYAHDNDDNLPYNSANEIAYGPAWYPEALNWVYPPDYMSWWAGYTVVTNTSILVDDSLSSLGKYVSHQPAVYHCPADQFLSPMERAAGWTQRARSISMNLEVGDGLAWDGRRKRDSLIYNYEDASQNYHPSHYFTRLTELVRLSPTMACVFLDEHPDSIGGTSFDQVYVPSVIHWTHLPANYHDRGCTFSFADGHAEYKKWLVPNTLEPVTYYPWDYPLHPEEETKDRRDYEWMARRTLEPSIFDQ